MKTAKEFDEAFDNNEDIDEYIDWSSAIRPNIEQRRVNLDLPRWMIDKLDIEDRCRTTSDHENVSCGEIGDGS